MDNQTQPPAQQVPPTIPAGQTTSMAQDQVVPTQSAQPSSVQQVSPTIQPEAADAAHQPAAVQPTQAVSAQQTQQTDLPVSSPPPSPNSTLPKVPIIAGIVVLIAVIGMGAYMIFGARRSPAAPTVAQVQPTSAPQSASPVPLANQVMAQPTPVISPVTAANAEQTLNNTNISLQQSIDQANTDINALNSIDTTQDNTNGL